VAGSCHQHHLLVGLVCCCVVVSARPFAGDRHRRRNDGSSQSGLDKLHVFSGML